MRAQLNREYEQLEQVIQNEKEKQLRGMRAAMLERRIKKERKRKAELAELRQQEMRNSASVPTLEPTDEPDEKKVEAVLNED